ncbi:hypothetical protein ACP179_17870 [Xenorhabdus stockiae]|uniref:hypothetical protein n=1 Tax=Xenorhabdus stockiae TaxID=351614 RepID=UPI003CE79867
MSTPNEVRNEGPIFEGRSNRTAKELAGCIYHGWTNTRVLFERDNTTHTESFNDIITVFTWKDSMFADVKNSASGSSVKFYKTILGAVPVEENRKEIVEQCL